MVILLWDDERGTLGLRVTDTKKDESEKLDGLNIELDVKVKGELTRGRAWKGTWKTAESFIYPFRKYLVCLRHWGA